MATTECKHIIVVEGEYRVMRCSDCGRLLIYKILTKTGEKQNLKFVGFLDVGFVEVVTL